MKIAKEAAIGIVALLAILGAIAASTGAYGLLYIGFAFVIAVISINLFSRKSKLAKAGAVILNTDLLFKLLMPKQYKKRIRELEERERNENT